MSEVDTSYFDEEEKKRKAIENWNERPEIKDNKIKAIDSNKEKSISNGKYKLLNIFAGIGVFALLIIAGAFGIMGYTIYKDGSLRSSVTQICGGINVTLAPTECPSLTCPDIPETSCPTCQVNCPAVTVRNYFNGTE